VQSFLIFFIKFAVVSFAGAVLLMCLLEIVKRWIQKERESWGILEHSSPSTEYRDDVDYFKSFFHTYKIPMNGAIWMVPEDFYITIEINGGRSCTAGPGYTLETHEDCLVVSKVAAVPKPYVTDRFIDWDAIDWIDVARPLNTELLDGDGEHIQFDPQDLELKPEEPCKCTGCIRMGTVSQSELDAGGYDGSWHVDGFQLYQFLFGNLDEIEVVSNPVIRLFFTDIAEFEKLMKHSTFKVDHSNEDDDTMCNLYHAYGKIHGYSERDRRNNIYIKVTEQTPPESMSDEKKAKLEDSGWRVGDVSLDQLRGSRINLDPSDPEEPVEESEERVHEGDMAYESVLTMAPMWQRKRHTLKKSEVSTPTECVLKKEVCQECMNEIDNREYMGEFVWSRCNESAWHEGRVGCPGDYSIDEDGEGGGMYPTSSIPEHCPHAAKHSAAMNLAKDLMETSDE